MRVCSLTLPNSAATAYRHAPPPRSRLPRDVYITRSRTHLGVFHRNYLPRNNITRNNIPRCPLHPPTRRELYPRRVHSDSPLIFTASHYSWRRVDGRKIKEKQGNVYKKYRALSLFKPRRGGHTPVVAVPASRLWSLVLMPEPRSLQVVGVGVGAVPVHRNSPTAAVVAEVVGPVGFRRPNRGLHLASATEGLLLPLSRLLRVSLDQHDLLSCGAALFFCALGRPFVLAPLLPDPLGPCDESALLLEVLHPRCPDARDLPTPVEILEVMVLGS